MLALLLLAHFDVISLFVSPLLLRYCMLARAQARYTQRDAHWLSSIMLAYHESLNECS